MFTIAQKLSVVSAIALLTIGLAGCSAENDGSAIPDSVAPDSSSSEGTEGEGSEGNDGRAFDSTDDAVITAIGAAMDPDDIGWDGKVLVVSFNEGSVGDPTAGLGCLAINTIIADDEAGIVRYPDGDFDCETRR